MRITPDERDHLLEIIRDEIEASGRRIAERLGGMGARVPDGNENRWESVRRFYEDLSGKVWSEGDEECLASLGDVTESEVKSAMREAFRKSPVHPLPSFRYLLNLSRRPEAVTISARSRNPDAISAADRERLANLLAEQLAELAGEIVIQLGLNESKAVVLREHLEVAEGRIIGRLTPLI